MFFNLVCSWVPSVGEEASLLEESWVLRLCLKLSSSYSFESSSTLPMSLLSRMKLDVPNSFLVVFFLFWHLSSCFFWVCPKFEIVLRLVIFFLVSVWRFYLVVLMHSFCSLCVFLSFSWAHENLFVTSWLSKRAKGLKSELRLFCLFMTGVLRPSESRMSEETGCSWLYHDVCCICFKY